MVQFTIKQMLENGVHYGHTTSRWNPKMSKYIYGTYNKIHVIDLQKTAVMLNNALEYLKETVAGGGRVLFVGTKKQAAPIIKEYAEKCGQYYVNHRWIGGMLTNWKTISNSIRALEKIENQISSGMEGLTKKEKLEIAKLKQKYDLTLGGIRNMGGIPSVIFVIDAVKESIAIEEANKLGVPVICITDTNANPDNINFVVPGNDDAIKAIRFYCDMVASVSLEGLKQEAGSKLKDAGESVEPDMTLVK